MDLADKRVSLLACSSYDTKILDETVMWVLSAFVPENLHGKRILLKPNLISARKGLLACTDGRFILAAGRFFLAKGARVQLGDSPAYGSCRSVLDKMNLLRELEHFGIPVVEFDKVLKVQLSSGQKIGLARPVAECDFLVNLPRIKAHGQLRVTMAVKNCFGCVGGLRKAMLHMSLGDGGGFPHMLTALLQVLPDGISLVDGITAMHKTGPIDGEAFPLGLAAAATNPVALDTTLLTILKIDPQQSPTWLSCKEMGYGGTDINTLEFLRQIPGEFHIHDFQVPVRTSPIRFSPFRFLRGNIRRLLLRMQSEA